MERLTATEAARRFSDVLDAIERTGHSFVVTRHGRPVATIGPAAGGSGRAVRELLLETTPDPGFARDVAAVRAMVQLDEPPWTD